MGFKSDKQRKWCFASGVCKGKGRRAKSSRSVVGAEAELEKLGVKEAKLDGLSTVYGRDKDVVEAVKNFKKEFPEVIDDGMSIYTLEGLKKSKPFRYGHFTYETEVRNGTSLDKIAGASNGEDIFLNEKVLNNQHKLDMMYLNGHSKASFSAKGVVYHELGHRLYAFIDGWAAGGRGDKMMLDKLHEHGINIKKGYIKKTLGRYAASNLSEYVAEVFAASKEGAPAAKRYSKPVVEKILKPLYNEAAKKYRAYAKKKAAAEKRKMDAIRKRRKELGLDPETGRRLK